MARSSIIGEICYIFKKLDKIGESKREWKVEKIAPNGTKYQASEYIHNHDYAKKKLAEAKNFGRWVRQEFGIRSVFELRPEHHEAYIQYHQEKGNSPGHITNVESTLNIIQRGMNLLSKERGLEPVIWFEKRLAENNAKPRNRAYRADEIGKLRQHMSTNAQKALDLSVNLGIRSREACYIRAEHFIRTENGMAVYIPSKKDVKEKELDVISASGITKGGRGRYIPVPKSFQPRLEKMLQGLGPKDRVVQISEAGLRKALSRACHETGIESQGWHGFRHTYARNRLNELLDSTGMGADCRTALRRIFENRDTGRPVDYGFSGEHEKKVLETVRECVNKVNDELGHGGNRWALVETYMRE